MKIRLLKQYLTFEPGSTTEVSEYIGNQLIRDKFAEAVKDGAKPTRTKVAKPASVKA